jgi:LmbE family N-acetylglucosaminyl deacetylase
MKKVLVIAAHPDDELLGVGGTILKHTSLGDECFAVILGTGVLSRENNPSEIDSLRTQSKKAANILGYKKIHFEDFPDNSFDTVSLLEIVKKIEEYITKYKPDILYTHYGGDLNVDHQITYKAVITACRPCNKNCPEKILTFETLSSTEWQINPLDVFVPNVFVNIEQFVDTKKKAMSEYESELCVFPHSRSLDGIHALGKYRGIQSGMYFAEAFRLERKIDRTK